MTDRQRKIAQALVSDEHHLPVLLHTGLWTCDCGTIHASPYREDVYIHEIWAVREQNKELRALVTRLMDTPTTGDES